MTYEDVKRIRENPYEYALFDVGAEAELTALIDKAIQKQIPAEPILDSFSDGQLLYRCAACNSPLCFRWLVADRGRGWGDYCEKCGQLTDWEAAANE